MRTPKETMIPKLEPCRLEQAITTLTTTRWPVVVLWTHRAVLEAWGVWFSSLASKVRVANLVFCYERFKSLTASTGAIMAELDTTNVIALVVDFTQRPHNAQAVLHALRLDMPPLIVVVQKEVSLPLILHPPLAVCRYTPEDLVENTSPDLALLFVVLFQQALRHPLVTCDKLIDSGAGHLAVIQAWICLESALWYLVDRIRKECHVTPPPKDKVAGMIKFLKPYKEEYHLKLDKSTVFQLNALRNKIMHIRNSRPFLEVPPETARGDVEFVDTFIRANIGPNLVGFA